ncbi:Calcipressin-domain-containing protein [Mycena capillaripes]|nr:Calcipressin-domain-containing protein [Mycena capillaripes]
MPATYFISLSGHVSPSSPIDIQRTNTLAVTSIPKAFFQPLLLNVLRAHFASYGHINRWVPLPGFGRIIVVYTREDDAETAKIHCDPIVLEQTQDRSQIILHVYRADPNPLLPMESDDLIPEANYLRPPAIEKNFLISPPGSPPLQLNEKHGSGLEVLIEPHDGESGVGIYVQDCDSDSDDDESDDDWVYGESAPSRAKWCPTATALPPSVL